MRIECAGLTDTGCVRETNEDAFLVDCGSGLFLVADGMGGLEGGEVASRMAIETLAGKLGAVAARLCPDQNQDQALTHAQSLERKMVLAFKEANARIRCFALQGPGTLGMGTTLVALARCGDFCVLGNVGDSRAYLITDQGIRQISEDHSLVMAQVREGLLTPEQAWLSREKSFIYRALGMDSRLEVDTWIIPAAPGDVFLLCSDGLSNVLDDQDIKALVLQAQTDAVQDICARFIALALKRRARDNVTVVLARCLP
ncbi:MAG: serine/threonine protein [Desulfovibrionaceae bacterium]|nr:MAG: serine/threonine protein [Desulfovibrionaceae bacterium]